MTLTVVIGSLTPFVEAQQDAIKRAGSTPVALLTPEDVAAFYDGLIPTQLRRDDIGGAVIAVVKDGRVLFAKGYGYADVEAKSPVSVETTLFRPASISKLFTWTAVMQLVEQGKLDLDGDVNQYLDFQIPATYLQPVTLRNLMTHTGGFQEMVRGPFLPDGDAILPLREFLIERLPPRIYQPGTTPAYSNYGAGLAGYIVQRVSGQLFEDYIDEHIFRPLRMEHSTFRQPPPDLLKPMMSSGYMSASDPAKPFEIVLPAPTGGLAATAEDMTHFMIAHLQDGRFGEEQILKQETARLMHAREMELAAGMNGMALGFAEVNYNGIRAISHGGDTPAFHSQLYLVPDLGVGLFVSQNSQGRGSNLRTIVWRTFLDRYFPRSPSVSVESANAVTDSHELSGFYKSTRRFDTSILKLSSLTGQVRVWTRADGTVLSDLVGEYGQPKPLREVEPLRFCDAGGEDCVAFRRDAGGRLEMIGSFPHVIFQRVRWFETRPLNLNLISFCAGVFGLTLALWPVAALTRRHFGRRLQLTPACRRTRILARVVCAIDLGFILVGRALFQKLPDPALELWTHLLQAIGLVGALGTAVVILDAVRCWADRDRWWCSKVHVVVVTVACLGFVWFAILWNLFDFS